MAFPNRAARREHLLKLRNSEERKRALMQINDVMKLSKVHAKSAELSKVPNAATFFRSISERETNRANNLKEKLKKARKGEGLEEKIVESEPATRGKLLANFLEKTRWLKEDGWEGHLEEISAYMRMAVNNGAEFKPDFASFY